MQKVYYWVDKFEEKPTPQTVSNAKKTLDATRFNKFLELTGYTYNKSHRKGEQRIILEAMNIGDRIDVSDNLHADYSLVGRLNKEGYLFLIVDKKRIERVK